MNALTVYHEALVTGIQAHFGDSLETVQAYFPDWQSENAEAGLQLNTPAALIEIERLGVSEEADRGDGTDAINCQVAIHCVLGSATENLQQELRGFAAEMMRLLRSRKLSACTASGQPEEIEAMPGVFKQGAAGYDSFVVVFQQVVYLGENVWALPAGSIPQQVSFRRVSE